MSTSVPQNRKQRRQAAKQNGTGSTNGASIDSIPMALPDRSGPAGKTLYDLAEEREAELRAQADALNASRRRGGGSARVNGHLNATGSTAEADERKLDQILTTVFYTITLSMVHVTLDILVWHQYGQEIDYPLIFNRLLYLIPSLAILIYLSHTATANAFPTLKQSLFGLVAVGAGCRLLWIGNQQAFLAVMKHSAPTAVIWIWCIIEMNLLWALGSLLPVGAYILYNGFSIY